MSAFISVTLRQYKLLISLMVLSAKERTLGILTDTVNCKRLACTCILKLGYAIAWL